MSKIVIHKPESLSSAVIELPLSKSIANRMLVIGYLAGNENSIPIPNSVDSQTMQRLIHQLRADTDATEFNSGDAGTVFRFLTALLSVIPGNRILTGSSRMQQRPVGPLVDSLRNLGAIITYAGNDGYPPVEISGIVPEGGTVEIDGSVSSQFISALMMIGPLMKKGLKIIITGAVVSRPYIDLTAGLMKSSGIRVETTSTEIKVHPGKYLINEDSSEADWSAASYWYAMVSLVPGSNVTLKGLKPDSLQGDSALTAIFERLGVISDWENKELHIWHSGQIAKSIDLDLKGQPDLAPAIAVACAGNRVMARLTGLETLVIKESNRLEAIRTELEKLGYHCEIENNNALRFPPMTTPLKSNNISTYNDHRIAMSMAVLSTLHSPLVINDPGVVDKSYPDFWEHLKQSGFLISQE